MDRTKIEWTDATWNPLRGCSRVSEGCRNCYAERVAARFIGKGQAYEGLAYRHYENDTVANTIDYEPRWTGEVRLIREAMDQPLKWKRPRKIFVNSMSDLFHEKVSDGVIWQIFNVMRRAHWHTFQVLTKRPERMLRWFQEIDRGTLRDRDFQWPLPNVWLGVSVETQGNADKRIPLLLRTPAAVRWISAEPLLGPLDISQFTPGGWGCSGCGYRERGSVGRCYGYCQDPSGRSCDAVPCPRCGKRHYWTGSVASIKWVVAGGESGPGARPMDVAWAWELKDQCNKTNVPFLFKQWGEYGENGRKVGKKVAGRLLLGKTYDEYPVPA
ncbi:MAG: phage Gp37/Gp68 family protein [Sphingomonadales bacterium]|nr:phage Gp37/Gp68 family protein [Sphingomonadaceae bacterium]MBS3930390.1 phage Gp37/Gp68 family protein [Sphingomonadales bacterium]